MTDTKVLKRYREDIFGVDENGVGVKKLQKTLFCFCRHSLIKAFFMSLTIYKGLSQVSDFALLFNMHLMCIMGRT